MLNIDITSDIHTVFLKNNYKDLFWTNWVLEQSKNGKYLIIAWDINEDVSEIEKTLDHIIKVTNYKKIIITFWNHDIWYRPEINNNDKNLPYNNSIEKYFFLIEHFHDYKNKIHVVDQDDYIIEEKQTIITWNMWWYNYTINKNDKVNLEKFPEVNFDRMKLFNFNSADRINIKFSGDIKNNIEFAENLENKLTERLNKIKENNNLENYKVIWISHVKPLYLLETNSKYYIELSSEQWNDILKSESINKYSDTLSKVYGNAFYVNSNIHEIYKKFNVNIWIYWHTHHVYRKNIENIKYITNSFGYYLLEENNPITTI